MADSLTERLKQRAVQHADEQRATQDVQAFQKRVNDFITANADGEFTRLQERMKLRAEDVKVDGLPKYEYNLGSRWVQQENCVAALVFSKPFVNAPSNRLRISIGVHPNAMYFDESHRPEAVRYDLQAAATNEMDGIVWIGDLGEVTSEALVDIILENLTGYYLQNKPGSR